MNNKLLLQLASVVSAFGTVISVNAQSFVDTFDSYTVGSIAGQGTWQGWTGNAAVAGLVTTAQAASGTQSLQVVAGNDTVRPFTGVTSGLWRLTVDQFVPIASGGVSWVILMNQYPANLNWSLQMKLNLTGNVVNSEEVAGASVPLVKGQWVPIRMDINLDGNSVTSYYNNTLLATHAWQSTGINALQALDLYPDEGATTAQTGAVFYDNLQLTQIPEPSALALFLLGSLGFLARARKQA